LQSDYLLKGVQEKYDSQKKKKKEIEKLITFEFGNMIPLSKILSSLSN